jgi:glutamate-1-semialdehyde 2,1-aminomutase
MATIRHQPVDMGDRLRRARAVLPGGVSSGGRAKFEDVMVRAEGAYVWNADGKRFVDHLLAYGPIVVGHCDPRVNEAVMHAVSTCDLTWVGPQPGEVELAEAICEVIPSADRAAFCTSGTDASLHACHLARAATGRTKLLKFHGSYHGWHDQLAVGSRFRFGAGAEAMNEPDALGLHPASVADVVVVEWNDVDGLRAAFAERGTELAGAFAEPYVHSYGCVAPAPGFLEELRRLCTDSGVVLVFDEIKTGFRHALGGYQTVCGVTPDLTIFGKALANGYSLAGIAGRASLMDLLGSASEKTATIEGTYNASPYALAAGLATLEILRDGGIERLYNLGDRLRASLADAVGASGVDACVTGFGSEWMIYFRREPPKNYAEACEGDTGRAEAFRRAMFEAGILEPPFPSSDRRLCIAMTEADVDATARAAVTALAEIA